MKVLLLITIFLCFALCIHAECTKQNDFSYQCSGQTDENNLTHGCFMSYQMISGYSVKSNIRSNITEIGFPSYLDTKINPDGSVKRGILQSHPFIKDPKQKIEIILSLCNKYYGSNEACTKLYNEPKYIFKFIQYMLADQLMNIVSNPTEFLNDKIIVMAICYKLGKEQNNIQLTDFYMKFFKDKINFDDYYDLFVDYESERGFVEVSKGQIVEVSNKGFIWKPEFPPDAPRGYPSFVTVKAIVETDDLREECTKTEITFSLYSHHNF